MIAWISASHFWIAVALPLAASAFILSRSGKKELIVFSCAMLAFTPLSIETSYWSEYGLHAHPWPAIALVIFSLYSGMSVWTVYPASFLSTLIADLVIAYGHPEYPFGIGGAGVLDGLFVFPIALTAVGFGLFKVAPMIEMSYAHPTTKRTELFK